jgi:ubiquitin C-terminal hydrolase
MYGQYKSIVDCPKCQYESIQFDPFLMLSLPLINNNKKSIELIFIKDHTDEMSMTIAYDVKSKTTFKFALD